MWKAVILAAAWVRVAQTALPLPTYIKPCARSNPDFNACALRSARDSFPYAVKGDPSFRLLPLDPMQVEQVKVEVGGAGGLTVLMKNVHISGITDTKIEMTNFNFETRHIHHEATTPRLEVIGQYEVCGRVLQLPLSGSGNFNVTLAAYVKPCARSDPDFNACALKRAREIIQQVIRGDRKYKVPVLDPLEIQELKIAEGGPRQVGLTLIMRNAKVFGMKDSDLKVTRFDFGKKHVHYEMALRRAEIIGKYSVSGRILLLPILGNGDLNITLENVTVTYDHDFTLEPMNGDVYLVIQNPRTTVTPARAYIQLTNLFNGDPVLGRQMNIFLDENWKDVYRELSPAVITAFSEIISAIITGIAGSVPFDVAFPETLPPSA